MLSELGITVEDPSVKAPVKDGAEGVAVAQPLTPTSTTTTIASSTVDSVDEANKK